MKTLNSQISDPIVHFGEMPIEFDKNGLVILPSAYLRNRYVLKPVKAEYKLIKRVGWKDYFLKDLWEILPTGELRCINAEILKEQHGVMSFFLKKFAKNIFTGKSIMDISLPASIHSEQ